MQTTLHTATLDDARELAEMNRMLMEDEGADNPLSVDALEARMRHWLITGEYQAVLITHKDNIVGYVLFKQEQDDFNADNLNIFIRQYFVRRAYRRRGIGRSAFELVAENFFPDNATIILDVLNRNLQGRAFWEQLGFEPYYTTYRRTKAVIREV